MTHLIFVYLLCATVFSSKWTGKIRGNVTCNGKPYGDALVRMYKRRGPSRYILLRNTAQSDSAGNYVLENTATSHSEPPMVVEFRHRCMYEEQNCYKLQRIRAFEIKVVKGSVSREVTEMPTLELMSVGNVTECQRQNNKSHTPCTGLSKPLLLFCEHLFHRFLNQ